jgi:hypothetical protein
LLLVHLRVRKLMLQARTVALHPRISCRV